MITDKPLSGDTIEFDTKTGDRIRTMWDTTDDGQRFETRWIVSKAMCDNRRANGGFPEHTVHSWDDNKRKEHRLAVNAWPIYRERFAVLEARLDRIAAIADHNAYEAKGKQELLFIRLRNIATGRE